MDSAEVKIFWHQVNGVRFLKFVFSDRLIETEAQKAIKIWEQEFAQNVPPDSEIDMIWDCQNMKGYEAKAALAWKNTMQKLSSSIRNIWLITTNPLIKLGANSVTIFLPVNLKVVSREEEVV